MLTVKIPTCQIFLKIWMKTFMEHILRLSRKPFKQVIKKLNLSRPTLVIDMTNLPNLRNLSSRNRVQPILWANLKDKDQPAKPQKPLIQKQSAAYPLGKPQRQRPTCQTSETSHPETECSLSSGQTSKTKTNLPNLRN